MADKKTGYEKAAEAQAATEPKVQNGLPPAERKERKKVTIRKPQDDVRAINQIDAIVEHLPPQQAIQVLDYVRSKYIQKQMVAMQSAGPPRTYNTACQERMPGHIPGRPETMTIPQLQERDHG